jgi:TPR repeat protein
LNFGGGYFNLGLLYKEGKGVKQDDFKVLHSFTTDPALAVVGNKPTSINTVSALRIKSFIRRVI